MKNNLEVDINRLLDYMKKNINVEILNFIDLAKINKQQELNNQNNKLITTKNGTV